MTSNITMLVVICQVVRGIIIHNILEGEKICPCTAAEEFNPIYALAGLCMSLVKKWNLKTQKHF